MKKRIKRQEIEDLLTWAGCGMITKEQILDEIREILREED